jgi:hypothetical protein
MASATQATITQQVAEAIEEVARALTMTTENGQESSVPAASQESILDIKGEFADINELFHERGWTDGLPVIPPSEEHVRAMVMNSPYPPDHRLGLLPPAMSPVIIEKVAVNAVMAGCAPEFFPVVLAAVEGLLDENLSLYSMQTATNATAPLLIVNGPVVSELCLNSGVNMFGPGCRANATIGRAVRLVLLNMGKEVPGVTDPSTHGQPGKYTFCIAETEEESPWEPLHVELGFARSQSTVTLIGAGGPQNLFTYGCQSALEILDTFVGALCGLGHNNIIFPTGPLFVVSPEHAVVLARGGFSKRDVKNFLFEKARIPLSRFAPGTRRGILERRARWFEVVRDPDHIGVADDPQHITIVVAGGAGIHSQFLPTSFSKRPVTRLIGEKAVPWPPASTSGT